MAERRTRRPTPDSDRDRIAELEAELTAAHRTIDVLLDKAEARPRDATSQSALFEEAARMEQLVDARTREVEAANAELRAVTSNLDQIVRQRTRALAESEQQLREKNKELERQSTAKAEFISIVAHELRTPLTSIVGYLDLMAEGRFGEMPETAERPISSLRRNAHRLKRLVDEMLDVSRIEAGKVILRRVPLALGDVVHDVATELAPLAEAKRQVVTCEVADVPPVDGDVDKVHQIVVNLLQNSIRYTPEAGSIKLTVDRPPVDRFPGRWARLRVRDDGIGIASSQRSRLFEPFTDVSTPAKHHTSSGPDSAGLGLYIARGLIELHGGLIAVDSEEQVYTEFTVLLPLA
ncbi:MAG TPA: HAMP domain-containing sensor histidine kinase [Kofleriaceae bacterium]|nr:HAMP domain-containing sensor histidine kinase [Kofleriaceae bacterium]